MTAEDIAQTIHAHPTLGEITMEAAEVALGMYYIFIRQVRLKTLQVI
jgi:hypothetical protein